VESSLCDNLISLVGKNYCCQEGFFSVIANPESFWYLYQLIMPPPLIGGGIKWWCYLTFVYRVHLA